MEDVLEVYTRPYDPRFPQVCMDEGAKLLLQDKRAPVLMHPGQPERVDYRFESAGMRKLFLACEPLAGKRFVHVTQRRTSEDWAHFIRELVDVHYPDAEKIVLVMDNLNTHTPSSLYQTFAPAEARRILQQLELHYTPVHGSWLNMAEIELLGAGAPMPVSSHWDARRIGERGPGLATAPQCGSHHGQLAVHHRRCSYQTQAAVPFA